MKKFELLGYGILLIAFVLKLFRVYFHTYVILGAILFLLVWHIVMLRKGKVEKDSFFIGLSSVFFAIWLLFLTKFFPFPSIPMSLAVISLGIGIYFKLKDKTILADGRQWINLVLILICFLIFKMPRDQRYYVTGILFNYQIDSDYQTWSKYSWFLYLEGKYNQAFAASETALYIANQMRDELWVEKIIDQQEKIRDREWNKY